MLIYILIVLLIGLGLYVRENVSWSEEMIKRMEQEIISLRRELREHKERTSAYQSDTNIRIGSLDRLQAADRDACQESLHAERSDRYKGEKQLNKNLGDHMAHMNEIVATLTDKIQGVEKLLSFEAETKKQRRFKKPKKDISPKNIDDFIAQAEEDLVGDRDGK